MAIRNRVRRKRIRRQIAAAPTRGLTAQYLRDIEKARVSMAVWDHLPEEYRRFCSEYPRTAPAGQLAEVLELCGGDVDAAKAMLRELMPARPV